MWNKTLASAWNDLRTVALHIGLESEADTDLNTHVARTLDDTLANSPRPNLAGEC